MFKGNSSRGSQSRTSFFSFSTHHSPESTRSRGFSVVELLMTVVLIGIGVAVALPSYRDMVEKRQVTNAAEQVTSFVNSAQGVAMKTNRVVTVSYARTADDDWCVGAVTGETACVCSQSDPEAADYCQIGSQPFFIDGTHAGGLGVMHAVTGDGAYAFDPVRGFFRDLDDSLTMELRSESGAFRLNVLVNSTGRVTVCSADASHAVPGYGVCGAVPVDEGGGDPVPDPFPEDPFPDPDPEPLPEPDPVF